MSEMTPEEVQEPQGTETEQPEQSEPDWKNQARRWERQFKELNQKYKEAEPIVQQWKALEEASKSELQRAQEELTRWQNEAQTWRGQAVASRVERIAADQFADPSDALSAIDPGKYLDAGGQINEDAIKADLDALLERKPHWRKTTPDAGPVSPRIPAPNPAQGSGVNGTAAADPAQQFAAILRSQMKGT